VETCVILPSVVLANAYALGSSWHTNSRSPRHTPGQKEQRIPAPACTRNSQPARVCAAEHLVGSSRVALTMWYAALGILHVRRQAMDEVQYNASVESQASSECTEQPLVRTVPGVMSVCHPWERSTPAMQDACQCLPTGARLQTRSAA
jgi:hypothetical protein